MPSRALAPVVLLAMLAILVPTASASITGTLDIEGTGVIVSATTIDWLPVGGGTGSISTTSISDLFYDSGTALGVSAGLIMDLTSPTTFPVMDFMTFAGAPGLSFSLTGLGPGSSDFNCAGLSNGGSCSIAPGSPFVLTQIGNSQTAVILSAFGSATDSMGDKATWTGLFTAQLPSLTPAQVQANFASIPGYTIEDSYSGTFTATPMSTIPESSTSLMALTGLGLLLLARTPFRRRRSR